MKEIEQFVFPFYFNLDLGKEAVRAMDDGVNYEEAELVTPSTIVIEETSLQNEIV